ncbi:hypothetical protein [Bifidobacterium biavatii]|nr:hypothetical protein [Bifidobacterium biavatii]
MLTDLDGSIEEITVTLKNGIMPHDIEDVELYDIPYKIEGTDTDDIPYEPDMRPEDMLPPGVAERMAYTNLILEERELGVIDDAEAGRLLAEHLPGLTNR